METPSNLTIALIALQGVNTLTLFGIAFAAGKYAHAVDTLTAEVSTLRSARLGWDKDLVALGVRVGELEGRVLHRRSGDAS